MGGVSAQEIPPLHGEALGAGASATAIVEEKKMVAKGVESVDVFALVVLRECFTTPGPIAPAPDPKIRSVEPSSSCLHYSWCVRSSTRPSAIGSDCQTRGMSKQRRDSQRWVSHGQRSIYINHYRSCRSSLHQPHHLFR